MRWLIALQLQELTMGDKRIEAPAIPRNSGFSHEAKDALLRPVYLLLADLL